MTPKKFYYYRHGRVLAFLGISLALTSCDQVKQGLGLERHQPDEFTVIDRPPLSRPPSMTLKPPLPANSSLQTNAKPKQVQELILKPPASAYMPISKAEEDLLTKAGAGAGTRESSGHIRDVINQEQNTKEKRERGLAEGMVFWKDPKPKGDAIDPVAEKERLDPLLPKTTEDAD